MKKIAYGSYGLAVGTMILCAALAGCHVDTNKHADGKEDVSISTALGGLAVKTDSASTVASIGLPSYPGATAVQDGKDKGSADVNMNFGKFHLRVRTASFRSSDDQGKLKTFYRSAMARYGEIIECRGDMPVGTPTRTGQGLDCSDKDDDKSQMDHRRVGKGDSELKTGSKQHQRIVSFKPDGDGTRFTLILLDLPHGDDND